MESELEWTLKDDFDFITALHDSAILWDTNHADYIDHEKRIKAWLTLEKQLNIPAMLLKLRLNYYRTSYCAEYKKVIHDPNYVTNLLIFDELRFFFDHPDIRVEISNESNHNAINEDDDDTTLYLDSDDNEEFINENSTSQDVQFQDKYTKFGQEIANELREMNKYKAVKIAFKEKVWAAILEANKAVMEHKMKKG